MGRTTPPSNPFRDVSDFQQHVLKVSTDGSMRNFNVTPGYQTSWAGMHEELQELKEAKTVEDEADALIDLIYFAMGALVQMNVPYYTWWDNVHSANMKKVLGETKRGTPVDAKKPDGWNPPDHSKTMTDLEAAEQAGISPPKPGAIEYIPPLISPVLAEVSALRQAKSDDYSKDNGADLASYFPFGHESYAQMLHMKNKRVQSLLQKQAAGKESNFEGLRDTVLDLINYATFYVEAMDRGDFHADTDK